MRVERRCFSTRNQGTLKMITAGSMTKRSVALMAFAVSATTPPLPMSRPRRVAECGGGTAEVSALIFRLSGPSSKGDEPHLFFATSPRRSGQLQQARFNCAGRIIYQCEALN